MADTVAQPAAPPNGPENHIHPIRHNVPMTVRIAVVGDLDPADPRRQEIEAVRQQLGTDVAIVWFPSDTSMEGLSHADGLWLAGGPYRDAETAYRAFRWAQSYGIPTWAPDPYLDADPARTSWAWSVLLDQARTRAHYREAAENAAARRAELARLEALPHPYVHLLRGPRHRWWRPLVSLPLVVVLWFFIAALVTIPFALTGTLPAGGTGQFETSTWANLWLNLSITALIPATGLGIWAGHRRRWSRVLSITGRVRWAWLGRSLAVVTPVWALYLSASWVLTGQQVLPRPKDWVGLLVVTVLTTPLQSAAEEIGMRGGLVQIVGSWIPNARVAAVITAFVSAGVFAALHGSLDPWIIVDLAAMAFANCFLAWRTGGLEAGIAIHVVNNLLVSFTGIAFGGLEESYITGETTGSLGAALTSVAVMTVATLLLLWQAKRSGIAPARRLTPAVG